MSTPMYDEKYDQYTLCEKYDRYTPEERVDIVEKMGPILGGGWESIGSLTPISAWDGIYDRMKNLNPATDKYRWQAEHELTIRFNKCYQILFKMPIEELPLHINDEVGPIASLRDEVGPIASLRLRWGK